MRTRLILSVSLCAVIALSACSSESSLPDLSGMGKITVISREEGSGTRDEFENIIGTGAKGTDNIALSTAEVSEIISDDINAVGYTAYNTAELNENVKAVDINGIALPRKISQAENILYAETIILHTAENYPPQKPIFLHM
ncbi:MAG: hypothetical protein SPE43_00045 [Ruminococcus sp.]|nr:hypothetical protein [Ruminococcus sp.]